MSKKMGTPMPGRGWFKIFVVSVFCASGAGLSGYLLYCDLFQISLGGKGKTMAVVENQNSLVKRRASSSYLWNRTQKGQDIFQRDSILVGPESSAVLRLKEGSLLEIGENSLIRLDDLQQLNQNFMRGAFVVRSEKGDQKLTIDKSGKVKKEALTVRLLLPGAQAKVYSLPGKPGEVTFRWKPFRTDVNNLSLQVSPDEEFPAMRTQSFALVDASATEKTVPLTPGRYYWRLTGPEAPVTESRSLRVAEAKPMKPVWPTTLPVETWKEGGGVDFRWVPAASPEMLQQGEHHLDVARDAEFKEIVRTEKVSGLSGSYRLNELPEGEYFWRVRSRFGDVAVTAPGQKITLQKVAKLPLTLLQPEAGYASLPPEKMSFRWDFDRLDARFTLEIEKRKDEQWQPLTAIKSARRQLGWKKPSPGEYRWRVLAQPTKGDDVMGESEWREVSFFEMKPLITLLPAAKQKFQFWTTPDSLELKWEPVTGANLEYEIEYSLSAGLKHQVQRFRTRESSFVLEGKTLVAGTYYWRVKAMTSTNQPATLSEVQSFELSPFPLLSAPANAFPKTGETLAVMQMEKDPDLGWDAVPEAVSYEVTLKNAKGISLTEKTTGPAFSLKGFSAGKYDWSVRAIDRAGRQGEEMAWRQFTLHFGPLPAPKSVISEVKE